MSASVLKIGDFVAGFPDREKKSAEAFIGDTISSLDERDQFLAAFFIVSTLVPQDQRGRLLSELNDINYELFFEASQRFHEMQGKDKLASPIVFDEDPANDDSWVPSSTDAKMQNSQRGRRKDLGDEEEKAISPAAMRRADTAFIKAFNDAYPDRRYGDVSDETLKEELVSTKGKDGQEDQRSSEEIEEE